MIICGLIFIGMVFGAGMAAIYWRGVADESKTLRQALDQANGQTAAANEIIDAQRAMLAQQGEVIKLSRQELHDILQDHWPVQADLLRQHEAKNATATAKTHRALRQQATSNKDYEDKRP